MRLSRLVCIPAFRDFVVCKPSHSLRSSAYFSTLTICFIFPKKTKERIISNHDISLLTTTSSCNLRVAVKSNFFGVKHIHVFLLLRYIGYALNFDASHVKSWLKSGYEKKWNLEGCNLYLKDGAIWVVRPNRCW